MKALKVLLPMLRVCGGLLLLLGLIIWTGNGDGLIPVHVTIGVVLIVSLWTIAVIAARAGVSASTVALAIGWGVLVVVLGAVQEDLVTGEWHWTIQVLHLAVSMGAIWWGGHLVQLIRREATRDPSLPTVARSSSP